MESQKDLRPAPALLAAPFCSERHCLLPGQPQESPQWSPRSYLLSPARGFPSGSDGKAPACSAGDPGSIPVSGRPPEGGHGNPLQYSRLRIPGQSSLVGYSSGGRRVGHDRVTNTYTVSFPR